MTCFPKTCNVCRRRTVVKQPGLLVGAEFRASAEGPSAPWIGRFPLRLLVYDLVKIMVLRCFRHSAPGTQHP